MHHSRFARCRGFTLIEVLVVMLIIGIMIAGIALTSGLAHGDRDLENERDRILALIGFMRDQATLQSREYGLRCFEGGYEFVAITVGTTEWQRNDAERTMRARQLPEGLTLSLTVEGRPVQLPEHNEEAAPDELTPDELAPQIVLYSSGELSLFELTIRRGQDGAGFRLAPASDSDKIEATELAAGTA